MTDELEDLFAEAEQEDVQTLDVADDASRKLVSQLLIMRRLRNEKDQLEARVKEINKILEEYNPLVLAQLDALGIPNMRVEGVGLVYRSETVIPTVLENDKFLEWIDEHGDGAIAERKAHWQTVKAWYNDRLANGDELPPEDVVKTFTKREVRFRK